MSDLREGGCLCGAVRYKIDLTDAYISNCHCRECQRQAGAPYLSFAVVPIEQFEWIAEPSGKLNVSDKATRYFCRDCGTYIRWHGKAELESAEINIVTLDSVDNLKIDYEIFTETRLPWVMPIEGIPQYLRGKSD
jgi:hypothetical protein